MDTPFIPIDNIIKDCGVSEDLINTDTRHFTAVAKSLIRLYAKKNHDYGNTFADNYDKFGHMYLVSRLYEKVNRLINIHNKGGAEIMSESGGDTLMDIACYAIMGLVELDKIPEPEAPIIEDVIAKTKALVGTTRVTDPRITSKISAGDKQPIQFTD